MQKQNKLMSERKIFFISVIILIFACSSSCDFTRDKTIEYTEQLSDSNQSSEIASLTDKNALPASEYPLGDIPLTEAEYTQLLKTVTITKASSKAIMQGSYDARNDGIVTSAKNQGNCGSCWAFASVGALESHLIKQYPAVFNNNINLSEQQQVSCNTSESGCSGGRSKAIRFWETRGPALETCFPYSASNSPCSYCSNYSHEIVYDYRVANYYSLTNYYTVYVTDINQVKASLYQDGPSYFRFNVYTDFFNYWDNGNPGEVYINTSGSLAGGHAILIIGWDDSRGAYLCKNSWGTSAGPNNDGTFWIAYNGHANNLGFGMVNFTVVLPCDPRPCVPNTCIECSTNTCP